MCSYRERQDILTGLSLNKICIHFFLIFLENNEYKYCNSYRKLRVQDTYKNVYNIKSNNIVYGCKNFTHRYDIKY